MRKWLQKGEEMWYHKNLKLSYNDDYEKMLKGFITMRKREINSALKEDESRNGCNCKEFNDDSLKTENKNSDYVKFSARLKRPGPTVNFSKLDYLFIVTLE